MAVEPCTTIDVVANLEHAVCLPLVVHRGFLLYYASACVYHKCLFTELMVTHVVLNIVCVVGYWQS